MLLRRLVWRCADWVTSLSHSYTCVLPLSTADMRMLAANADLRSIREVRVLAACSLRLSLDPAGSWGRLLRQSCCVSQERVSVTVLQVCGHMLVGQRCSEYQLSVPRRWRKAADVFLPIMPLLRLAQHRILMGRISSPPQRDRD
ncbi:hypothetical protein EJ03DRAFT_124734 [Teratosphaeria nubilosa]|uniref:Uncharacterized protein n=1 Tax=Teratosphaeria nubilosa TaxID=161662 RepID=A0A6G1LJX8_9PEZI|nr:hypothetical protein EJ03DRAFT_124734 [Teratosphaeria nubilosa]